MKVECPQCGTHVEKPLDGEPVCPDCGYGSQAAGAPAGAPPAGGMSPPDAPQGQPGTSPGGPPSTQPGGAPAGQPGMAPYGSGGAASPKQGMAITSLVLGIVGICTAWIYVGLLFGIAALVLGILGFRKAKQRPTEFGGRGMALAGIITGAIATLLSIVWIIMVVVAGNAFIDALCEDDPDQAICEDRTSEGPAVPALPVTASVPLLTALPVGGIARSRHAT